LWQPQIGDLTTVQRDDKRTITFPPDSLSNSFDLPAGKTAQQFIEDRINDVEHAYASFWNSSLVAIDNFDTAMHFSDSQSADFNMLNSALKAAAISDANTFLRFLTTGCPELGAPIGAAKDTIAGVLDDYNKAQQAAGQVRIKEFIMDTRNKIDDARNRIAKAWQGQIAPMQAEYIKFANGSVGSPQPGPVGTNPPSGGSLQSNVVTGPGAQVLNHLSKSVRDTIQAITSVKAPMLQQQITEEFAKMGSGKDDAGPELHLACVLQSDGHGGYTVKQMDPTWMLVTKAPQPGNVADSLRHSLDSQGKAPIETNLRKVVHAEIGPGDRNDYRFFTIDHVESGLEDSVSASLHHNDPAEFRKAWDSVLKEKVKGVSQLSKGGNP
jgi:hypothetical protein